MRRPAAVVIATAGLALAGCGSSGGAAPRSSPATTAATAQAAAIAATMRKGLAGLTSAHISVDAGTLGATSAGEVAYSGGTATRSDITVDSGADKTEIVTIGAQSYAKLPAGRNDTGKPWVRVSATSKNRFVAALAGTIGISKAAASLPAVADVVGAATSARTEGRGRYALVVEPAKAGRSALATLLAGVGQSSVPVDLTLDSQGRPTKIVISFELGAQTLAVTIAVDDFGAPVSITAPPANEIASG